MKKTIVSIILFVLCMSHSITVFSQYSNPWDIQLISTNINTSRIKFLNAETGYIGVNDYNQTPYKSKILKTTNKGLNWNYTIWQGSIDPDFTFEIINENQIQLYHQMKIKRTSDGGSSWYANDFNLQPFVGSSPSRPVIMKFFDASNGYAVYINSFANYPALYIFKTNDGGQSWVQVYYRQGEMNNPLAWVLNDFTFIENDPNRIFFVGYYHSVWVAHKKAFLTLKTTDGGSAFDYQSGSLGDNCSYYQSISTLPGDPNQKRMILTKYNYANSNDPINGTYCKTDYNEHKINNDFSTYGTVASLSFSDNNRGFLYASDYIYKTDNSGTNWTLIGTGLPSCENRALSIYSIGDAVYALSSNGNLIRKLLSSSFKTIDDNQVSFSGSFSFNWNGLNLPYITPTNFYIGGGVTQFNSYKYFDNNNKLFYKWSDDYLNPERNLNVYNDNFSMNAQYKTKLTANNPYAIYNSNQTKAIRDTNGTIHQIHESIGGIFYSRSTDNGETFQNEEIVNAGTKWINDFPGDVSSLENRSPSLCEIRNIQTGKALSIDYPNVSIEAVWQHYNPNGNMEIRVGSRVSFGGENNDWYKYGLQSNMNGIFKSFQSNSSYQSKPTIFASTRTDNGFSSEPYSHFILVPHLEPSSNDGNKIVVTAKYQNYSINPSNGNTNDFIIADGNTDGTISDYSVTAEPTFYQNIYNGYTLHFSYKRGNKIVYKNALISLASIGGYTLICRLNPNEPETIISDGDNQLNRYTPDISLRNGKPVVTYRGYKVEYRIVIIENGSDDPQTLITPHYPVIVKCKGANGWESAINYDCLTQQENPNIEGSKNANAYILNFRKNNSNFQFVKIDNLSGYYCSPGVYTGSDAKLVKNSYLGQFGSGAGPLLLTLSNQSSSLYNIWKQPFAITNSASSNDGFSNLDGVIEKDNTLYSLTLGPIIASNTTYGFGDETPPQTVQNPVEFNETMVSAVFPLSNNDTLILGAHGKYTSVGQSLQPLKYHVNLVNSTSGQIHRELFRDTINIEDSIGIEFLRGYVINSIANGTDQFYVQMIVDTVYAEDGDYMMAGVYADNTPPEGDAPHNYKTKVFFENGSNPLTNTGNLIPKDYALSQNYPNPFNPTTTIKFSLPKDGFVTLKIYDITGREVKTLANDVRKAGYYSVTFNASTLASGVYFYRIQSSDFVMTKRMVLLK